MEEDEIAMEEADLTRKAVLDEDALVPIKS